MHLCNENLYLATDFGRPSSVEKRLCVHNLCTGFLRPSAVTARLITGSRQIISSIVPEPSVIITNMSGRSSSSTKGDPPRKEWNLPPELEREALYKCGEGKFIVCHTCN
jgi:hypothetical protein